METPKGFIGSAASFVMFSHCHFVMCFVQLKWLKPCQLALETKKKVTFADSGDAGKVTAIIKIPACGVRLR